MEIFANDDSKNPPPLHVFERLLRRFARVSYFVAVLLVYLIATVILGLALAPALALIDVTFVATKGLPTVALWALRALSIGAGFFVFGFALLVVVPVFNFLLPTRVDRFRGGYYTIHAVPWFLHNALFYLVRFTFLPFVTLTPFGVWFLTAMGMKVGRHAFINTEYISDPRMITIGDDAALGGSVRIFAHYGGGGNLVIAPVTIGARATIGLAAIVMGDVEVGEGATVLPNSVLLPGTRVPPGETWGGVPARPIPRDEMEQIKQRLRG